MEQMLLSNVPTNYIICTIIILIVTAIVCIKTLPSLGKFFESLHCKTNEYDSLKKGQSENAKELHKIKEMLERDYETIIEIKAVQAEQNKFIEDSKEERKLLITGLLGVINGVQELGANGPTKEAQRNLQKWLIHQAHE